MRRPYVKPTLIKVDPKGPHGQRIAAVVEGSEQAKTGHVQLQTAVLIHMHMPDGRVLRHDGFTSEVSTCACLFTMETKAHIGQRMVLVNPKSRAEQPGTVAHVKKSPNGGYQIMFKFDNPTSHLWFA